MNALKKKHLSLQSEFAFLKKGVLLIKLIQSKKFRKQQLIKFIG